MAFYFAVQYNLESFKLTKMDTNEIINLINNLSDNIYPAMYCLESCSDNAVSNINLFF